MDLPEILRRHAAWINFDAAGVRADLSRTNLSRADLTSANLSKAHLSGANLSGANLSGADLTSANLSAYAQVSFSGHGERGRMLTVIRQTEESDMYFCCGCFRGSLEDITTYIKEGEARFRQSRTLALETVLKLMEVVKA